MKQFSYTDLAKTPGEILDTALVEPIALTKHGKEKIVMLSAERYRRLTARPIVKAYAVTDAPDDVHDELMQGINAILDKDHV